MKKVIILDWGRTLYDPEAGKLFSDTIQVLEELHNKYTLAIVALATAGEAKIQERWEIIKEYKLEQYFNSILFDVKDKDAMYIKTLQELNIEPRDVIVVDDRVIRGIKWGNDSGATTVWFCNGKFKDEEPNADTGEPTHTIYALSDLLGIKDL